MYISVKIVRLQLTKLDNQKLELNNHCRNWAKILSIGSESGTGQHRRCCRALVNNYTSIPILLGLRKDHKGNIDGDSQKGPKLRPLCAANTAPNAALSNLMSKLVRAVASELGETCETEVVSTEEL